jgi:uncharacterized protein YjdB
VRRLPLILALTLPLFACPPEEEPVLEGLEVAPAIVELAAGRQVQVVATGLWSDGGQSDLTGEVVWISSNEDEASVSNEIDSPGLVTAHAEGASVVTATLDLLAASCEVTVLPAELELLIAAPTALDLAAGASAWIDLVGAYSDGSLHDVTGLASWGTSDPGVADVGDGDEDAGRVLAMQAGDCDVAASLDGLEATVEVAVREAEVEALVIEPTDPTLRLGEELDLVALATWTDGEQDDVSASAAWISSDSSHVELATAAGEEGRIEAVGLGGSIVEASFGGLDAEVVVTVVEAGLEGLRVGPVQVDLSVGMSEQLLATGEYSDGSEVDITAQVLWSSDDPAVATASNDLGEEGLLRAVGAGTTVLYARIDALEVAVPVTVGQAQPVGIFIEPSMQETPLGVAVSFTLTAVYSDGVEQDHSADAAWSTLEPTVAVASPVIGQEGAFIPVAVGVTGVQAELFFLNASAQLVVLPAELESIAVTPVDAIAAVGEVLQYEATGSYSDGSLTDITEDVFWGSSAPGFATVNNLPGSEGQVTAVAEGVATILANLSPVSGSAVLTVEPPALIGMTIEPAAVALAVGETVQLVATGQYTDGGEDVVDAVFWSSDTPAVAVTSNDAGLEGTVLATGPGSATVTATSGDVEATTDVEVTEP